MKNSIISVLALLTFVGTGFCYTAKELRESSEHALQKLYLHNTGAKVLGEKALV